MFSYFHPASPQGRRRAWGRRKWTVLVVLLARRGKPAALPPALPRDLGVVAREARVRERATHQRRQGFGRGGRQKQAETPGALEPTKPGVEAEACSRVRAVAVGLCARSRALLWSAVSALGSHRHGVLEESNRSATTPARGRSGGQRVRSFTSFRHSPYWLAILCSRRGRHSVLPLTSGESE